MVRKKVRNLVSLGMMVSVSLIGLAYQVGYNNGTTVGIEKDIKENNKDIKEDIKAIESIEEVDKEVVEEIKNTVIKYKGEEKTIRGTQGGRLKPIRVNDDIYIPIPRIGKHIDGTEINIKEGSIEFNESEGEKGRIGEFETKTVEGEVYGSAEMRKKEYTIFLAMTTWCPYCKDILEDLEAYSKELKEKNIEVVGVMLDKDIEQMRELQSSKGITFKVIENHRELEYELHNNIEGVPEFAVVDKTGKVVIKRVKGYPDIEGIKEEMEKILR